MKVQEGGMERATSERDGATELFARHSAPIYRYCLRRLGSREEAEDALQATYLNAWRSLKGGFIPRTPRPWLFQIAANVCSSTLRTRLGGTRLEPHAPEALEELAQVREPERDELLDLEEAVRELPERQRRALVLRHWHGLPYGEIAARMDVSDAAVETLLVRARGSVAATLAGREWGARVAGSARALVAWPFGLLAAKEAVASTTSQLKVGLGLACGTVAPLVAFGVLHTLVFSPQERREAKRAPVFEPVTQVAPPGMQSGNEARWLPVNADSAVERKPPKEQGGSEGSVQDSTQGTKFEHSGAEASAPTPASPAEGPSSPVGSAPHAGQVVICPQTGSKKKPGVTIHVSPQGAEHGLSNDPNGACG